MLILKSLYYALPIFLANMAPVLIKKLPVFNIPLDGGAMYKGKRVFGKNKTWRGVVFAVIFALITIFIQRLLYVNFDSFKAISLYDYSQSIFTLGVLLGLGAIIGDAIKSFFKRQLGRKPGTQWPFYDQIDFILGAFLFSGWFYWPGFSVFVALLIFTPALHKLVNVIGFKLGLKEVPW